MLDMELYILRVQGFLRPMLDKVFARLRSGALSCRSRIHVLL